MTATTVAAAIIIVTVGAVALAALTPWAWAWAHHEALRNLALVAAGVIAVPLAIWRACVAERQAETARRSLLNERDQKAAEMLGSTLLSVRLGGIYALQTLAAEHPPHYHLGVMRQFCAFVRGPQNPTLTDASPPAETGPRAIPKMADSGARPDNHARRGAADRDAGSESVREDVRAVMDAIAARSDAGIEVEQQEKRFSLDLSGANLPEWRFSEANLSGVNLSEADLPRVILLGANLSDADLSEADLSDADLSGADLSRAKLSRVILSRADLSRVILLGADLSRADLSGADLSRPALSPGPTSPGPTSPGPSSPGPTSPGPTSPGPPSPGVNLSGVNLSGGPTSPGPTSPGPTSPGPPSPGPTFQGQTLGRHSYLPKNNLTRPSPYPPRTLAETSCLSACVGDSFSAR